MPAARAPLYYRMTQGMRISARPSYRREQSNPIVGQFVFAYHIRIENCGEQTARLMTRRWLIHDEGGSDSVVEGDGVIGEQPTLAPGQVHQYTSFCVLRSTSGWMEGSYRFEREDGSGFDAYIPRFRLSVSESPDSVT